MAVRTILIRRPPREVWAVLGDPHRYEDWVVGTQASQPLDGDWPAPGSDLEYVIKIGWWRFSGRTLVRDLEPGRRLELEARGGIAGTARIGIETRPWGEDTLVTIDEHPLTGPGGRLHNPVSELLIQLRHRRMLRKFARVVESGTESGTESGSESATGQGHTPTKEA